MATIFISGSRKVKHLPLAVRERLDNIIEGKHQVVIGDAYGADTLVQNYLKEKTYKDVKVYFSASNVPVGPRNNMGNWETKQVATGGFSGNRHEAKDAEMTHVCDFGFAIWDGLSSGTRKNVERLTYLSKKVLVWNDKAAMFVEDHKPKQVSRLTQEEIDHMTQQYPPLN